MWVCTNPGLKPSEEKREPCDAACGPQGSTAAQSPEASDSFAAFCIAMHFRWQKPASRRTFCTSPLGATFLWEVQGTWTGAPPRVADGAVLVAQAWRVERVQGTKLQGQGQCQQALNFMPEARTGTSHDDRQRNLLMMGVLLDMPGLSATGSKEQLVPTASSTAQQQQHHRPRHAHHHHQQHHQVQSDQSTRWHSTSPCNRYRQQALLVRATCVPCSDTSGFPSAGPQVKTCWLLSIAQNLVQLAALARP